MYPVFFSSKKRADDFKEQIYSLHACATTDEILNLIKSQPDFTLLIHIIADPIIREYVYHEKLRAFWDSQVTDPQALHDKFDLKYPYHDLHVHPKISSLDLLLGYYLYKKSQRARTKEKRRPFLAKSAEYGCFDAILDLNNKDLKKLPTMNLYSAPHLINQMMSRMTELANLHATPGFIHLAKTCLCIADYWDKMGDIARTNAAYKVALEYLYIANKLSPYSQASIHNAYFGQGLGASNRSGITDIPTAIDLLLSSNSDIFDMNTIKGIQQRAEITAARLESHYQEDPSSACRFASGF